MLFATGWAGFTASVRDLERTETVGKMKENTVTMIDKSMDGLSKVRAMAYFQNKMMCILKCVEPPSLHLCWQRRD